MAGRAQKLESRGRDAGQRPADGFAPSRGSLLPGARATAGWHLDLPPATSPRLRGTRTPSKFCGARPGISSAADNVVAAMHWMRAFVRTAPARDVADETFLATYLEWREQCEAVDCAYSRWTRSGRSGRDLAFETYRAALDRESKAASAYQRVAALEGLNP
jgi:hypothetical protein